MAGTATFTVYGELLTRTQRVTWLFRELNVPFEQIEERPPAEINPGGKMPALRVHESGRLPFDLYESFAITQYLAKRLGNNSDIGPATPEEEAKVAQWSLWVATEVEESMLALLETKGDPELAVARLQRALRTLDTSLEGKDYLVGNRFTVADVNVGSVVALWGPPAKFDFSSLPNVASYVTRLRMRPAFRQPKKAKL